jgi:murein DD-endopeptidase MepM/ murein hydrolase activator NlpD
VTYYAHMSKINVYSGPVTTGQQIGEEGNTGHSTGPHLHFEVRIDDVPINPVPWLAKHGVDV